MVADIISVDLLRSASRSESFPKDWTPDRTQAGLDNYRKFLLLAANNPDRLIAPTRDIDEFWHLHMLHPQAYHDDCQRLMGRILDHDGGFGASPEELPILGHHFEQTARLWEAAYGEPYAGPSQTSDGMTKCTRNCVSRCQRACKTSGTTDLRPVK